MNDWKSKWMSFCLLVVVASSAMLVMTHLVIDTNGEDAYEVSGNAEPYTVRVYGADISVDVDESDYHDSMTSLQYRAQVRTGSTLWDFVNPNDEYVQSVVSQLAHSRSGASIVSAIRFVVSLDYIEDEEQYGTHEWIAYPIETLRNGGGDCEDLAILMCSLLLALDYDAVLLDGDGHVMVGVVWSNSDGYYVEHDGKKYYTIESTNDAVAVGIFEPPDKCEVISHHPNQTMDALLRVITAFRAMC